ncbi:PEPxxWA-CTERM sorting domain-containing protein [Phenylobacterium sp.]|uniref:PEPxxWA-CTERM sorting domain-containing protein n=1 Tax=Phenylobacterium sp. TaxID=1871053 RepID=UPI0025E7B971|nr:PEPxxWA-CTERM sorting domain-containing protein [Phenylobacterium sp.]
MKRSTSCAALAALLLFAAGAPVQAASTLVDPWQSSGNGTILNDNFGTVPNMDLLYGGTDALGSSTPTGRMHVWALWGTLYHVAYTDQAVADIFLRPDAGWSEGVSLYSFDLGSYFGASETSEVRVYNGDYSALLFQDVLSLGANPATISPGVSSLDGLHIQFSGTPDYVAIDNIVVEAGQVFDVGGVPEPSTWILAIAGFGLTGAALRRRRTAAPFAP